jgi:hypothetical protein
MIRTEQSSKHRGGFGEAHSAKASAGTHAGQTEGSAKAWKNYRSRRCLQRSNATYAAVDTVLLISKR